MGCYILFVLNAEGYTQNVVHQYSQDADLRNTDLHCAALSGANLRRADLRGADLSGARFRLAKLNNADLRYAGLSGTDFNSAKLYRANFTGTNLNDVDLSNASVRCGEMLHCHRCLCPQGLSITHNLYCISKVMMTLSSVVVGNTNESCSCLWCYWQRTIFRSSVYELSNRK